MEYLVNARRGLEREADYEKRNDIVEKWEFLDVPPFGNGNLSMHLLWSDGRQARWEEGFDRNWETDHSLSQVISSALLLYRCAATFDTTIKTWGQKGYKAVWHLNLLHKPTGQRVGLGEHKGAAGFWTVHSSLEVVDNGQKEAIPQTFLDDIKELLEYLVSDVCAHPYDGLVAGSVA